MHPGISRPLSMVINCMNIWCKKTAFLSPMLYIIRAAISGCYCTLLEPKGSHGPWVCNPLYSSAHYALQHLQVWHGHQDLLPTKQSQVWPLWHILPTGRGDSSCLPFLARCCGAAWFGHLFPDWVAIEWTAKGIPMLWKCVATIHMRQFPGEILLFIF